MNGTALTDPLAEARDTIRSLQEELAETNRGLVALTLELEQRVEARTAELRTANQELEAFAYSVSHDLRAPLRAIDGYSRLLEEDFANSLNDDGRSMLTTVRESVRDMQQLIDDLLAFSRMNRQEMTQRPLDVLPLAQEVAEELRQAHSERAIEFALPERIPAALGDRAMIREVLRNLLGNAVKYTAPREVAQIGLQCRESNRELAFSVRDNGVGFDMKYADRLFRVFQRLHSADEFEGTGIGLAIVERIVKRHGGRVWAEGEVEKGATVYFTLSAA